MDEPVESSDESVETADEPDESTDVPAEWMDPADEPILELMREEEVFSPDHIAKEGICRPPVAAYRCRELAERGLLTRHMVGVYDITDLGERVLEGAVDPATLGDDDSSAADEGEE